MKIHQFRISLEMHDTLLDTQLDALLAHQSLSMFQCLTTVNHTRIEINNLLHNAF